LFSIFDKKPISLSATGASHSGNGIENIAYINLYYPNNMIAHLHVNWLSPLKERKIMIAGNKKMLVWDDLNLNESIKIYDTGIGIKKVTDDEKRKFMISYRYGDIFIPKLSSSEPLSLVIEEFVESIIENRRPATDGTDGLNVLKVLEAINISMKNNSKEVILNFKSN
jgi:predicted dehydrogenase